MQYWNGRHFPKLITIKQSSLKRCYFCWNSRKEVKTWYSDCWNNNKMVRTGGLLQYSYLTAIYSTSAQAAASGGDKFYFSIFGWIRKIMIESIFEIDDIFGQEWKMMIYCFEPSLTFYPEIAKRIYWAELFLTTKTLTRALQNSIFALILNFCRVNVSLPGNY